MNNFITTTGLAATAITITQEAHEKRDDLLYTASHLTTVSTPEEAQLAADGLKEIKNFTRLIEASRKEVKDPILTLGKRVDALASELTDQLEVEARRIGTVLAAWQAEQNRIAEEIRQKAFQEEVRIRYEAEAKEKAAREEAQRKIDEAKAEADRKATELREQAERARSPEKKEALLAQASGVEQRAEQAVVQIQEKAGEDSQARQEQLAQVVVERRVAVAAVSPQKQTGIGTRPDIQFEVTDILALYKHAPYLVKLEPNNSSIKSALKSLPRGQTLPGVKHWETLSSIVR